MANSVRSIPLDKLDAHPDNPNKQSRVNFAKLVRNIERTGRYEPLIVRPSPDRAGCFQIINGHHRCRALMRLGYKSADCVVWDIDDEQTDILLATLNRLGGSDKLGKKLKLLKRLNKRFESGELAKLLPLKQRQIERLTSLKIPSTPAEINAKSFANPMVFFLDDTQQQIVEDALSLAEKNCEEKTKAARKAAALALVAQYFLDNQPANCRDSK
jgi:ParB/RepB/Spo0J family partition protein